MRESASGGEAISSGLSILHVVPPEPFGGAQVLALDLARHQRVAGLNAQILFTAASDMAVERARRLDIPASAPAHRASRPARMLSVAAAFRQTHPDILHLHLPPPWLAPLLVMQRRAVIVFHLHSAPPARGRLVDHLATGPILRRCARAIAVSRWISDLWTSAFRENFPRCEVVYNAVALPDRSSVARPAFEVGRQLTFGVATRLADDKGLGEFLEIAAAISRLHPSSRFRIAGSGPLDPYIRLRVQELGIDRLVELPGFVDDITGFWRGIDVAIFTAPREPFGLRLLEPIAAGAAVVAFRTGAGSDEVIDRCRGIVAVPSGDISGAANSALALASDDGHRQRLVDEGRADIERSFNFERMEREVRAVYDSARESVRVSGLA